MQLDASEALHSAPQPDWKARGRQVPEHLVIQGRQEKSKLLELELKAVPVAPKGAGQSG